VLTEAWDKTPQSTLFKAWNKGYSDRPSSNGSSNFTDNDESPPAENLKSYRLTLLSSKHLIQTIQGTDYDAIVQQGWSKGRPDDSKEQQIPASNAFQVCINYLLEIGSIKSM